MKRMFRILCVSLCLIFSLNCAVIASASTRVLPENSNAESQKIKDLNNYDIHKIVFPKSETVIANDSTTTNKYKTMDKEAIDKNKELLKNQNMQNINKAKEFVKSLGLQKQGFYGLEEAYLKELDSIATKDGYLQNYAVYVPKTQNQLSNSSLLASGATTNSTTNPVYYGSLDGFQFQASFTVYDMSYRDSQSDSTTLQGWFKGITNLLLCYAKTAITVPFTILNFVGTQPTYYTGSWLDLTTSEEVTSRIILIQDKNMKASPNPNGYAAVLHDMSKVVTEFAVYNSNNPYVAPQFKGQKGPQEVPSQYFYNSSVTMQHAEGRYLSYGSSIGDMYEDIVPTYSMTWK